MLRLRLSTHFQLKKKLNDVITFTFTASNPLMAPRLRRAETRNKLDLNPRKLVPFPADLTRTSPPTVLPSPSTGLPMRTDSRPLVTISLLLPRCPSTSSSCSLTSRLLALCKFYTLDSRIYSEWNQNFPITLYIFVRLCMSAIFLWSIKSNSILAIPALVPLLFSRFA